MYSQFAITALLAILPLQSLAQRSLQLVSSSVDGVPSFTETTVKSWELHRKRILENVQLVMGELPDLRHRVPLCAKVLSESTENGIRYRKVMYYADSQSLRIHAWLLVPAKPKTAHLPAVLCLHQTTKYGKDEPVGLTGDPELAYARELAEQGFICLAPDYPSFGEYEYDFDTDAYASGSMKAIYDNIRAIDFLSSLSEVDSDRIGVIGHSLGGHNAIFTAIFEPRLKVIVSSCGFTRFGRYQNGDLTGWTSPRYMPRIKACYDSNPDAMPFDFADMLAAFAPRPFLAIAPVADHNFDVIGVREVMKTAFPIYRLYSAENRISAIYPECQHQFPPAVRKQAYKFIARHLKSQE